MVIVDGRAFRVQGTGQVTEARTDAETPFAAVTRFSAEVDVEIGDVSSLIDLRPAATPTGYLTMFSAHLGSMDSLTVFRRELRAPQKAACP
jgi:hypothetical protein